MGGRIGYSAATGVLVVVLTWFGIVALMMALIRLVAISPILLYIGMLIGAQAFQETPKATRRPWCSRSSRLAAWGRTPDRQRAGAAGTDAGTVGLEARPGRRALSGPRGARRRSDPGRPMLGAIAVIIIDGKYEGRGLLAHRRGADLLRLHARRRRSASRSRPSVAAAYAIVAAFLFALSRMPAVVAMPAPMEKAAAATPAE